MKRLILITVIIAIVLIGCASTSAPPSRSDFSYVQGREWKLTEVRINDTRTGFNRASLSSTVFGELFTVNFNAEDIGGVGALNRFSSPYSLGDGRAITFALIRSTLMAPLSEPEGLREHDFFVYLQNTHRWNLANNNLELYSRTGDGREIRLIFSQ
ncbi:MAG: META domain-containing protein [Treponema sp.]|jgi:heat shock protein HslJ|nr:META domain-containing protein [Treponema sp.]